MISHICITSIDLIFVLVAAYALGVATVLLVERDPLGGK